MKFTTLVVGLCLLVGATQASASVVNGSFEDTATLPDPATPQSAWQPYGFVDVKDKTFLVPTHGNQQAFASTIQDAQPGLAVGALETALGLTPGFLANLSVINGSALSQQISGQPGNELRFDWNFLTEEINFNAPAFFDTNDFAFVVFDGQFVPLAFADPAPTGPTIAQFPFATGYTSSTKVGSFILPNQGNPLVSSVVLSFGVVNVDTTGNGDQSGNSALAIDNVQILSTVVTPVPEPASLALLTSGLVGLLLYRRRARQ